MSMAARFYAQTLSNLDLPLAHNVGPYYGAVGTAAAFGVTNLGWYGGIGNGGTWTATGVVTLWMNSPTHRSFILREDNRYMGFGSQLGGRWYVFHYLFVSRDLQDN
ncbi:MAG: CAP domain-containing protein [Defluviitaleaceae bacterium]|nr:CAP domain-containing protein [Defluviitaleaceae bacterium]